MTLDGGGSSSGRAGLAAQELPDFHLGAVGGWSQRAPKSGVHSTSLCSPLSRSPFRHVEKLVATSEGSLLIALGGPAWDPLGFPASGLFSQSHKHIVPP